MDDNFSLGNRLRQLRQERALSQEQVAHLAEITPAYYGQVERGQKNISVAKLEKVCKAMDISLAHVFAETETSKYSEPDEITTKILHQLNGRSESEKEAILRIVKQLFLFKDGKS